MVRVPHVPPPVAILLEGSFCLSFSWSCMLVLAVCFVLINLVSAFSPKCVTDSLYKYSFMSSHMHRFCWLSFICSILFVIV